MSRDKFLCIVNKQQCGDGVGQWGREEQREDRGGEKRQERILGYRGRCWDF